MEKQFPYSLNDIVELKKPHPCLARSKQFKIIHMGAEIRLKCLGCGRSFLLSRSDFHERLSKVIK